MLVIAILFTLSPHYLNSIGCILSFIIRTAKLEYIDLQLLILLFFFHLHPVGRYSGASVAAPGTRRDATRRLIVL
jgi:hypothetical protein